MTEVKPAEPIAKRARKMAREPEQQMPAKPQTKSDLVRALLARADGATIDQLVAATGWLPHTTRAMLTGLKKKKGHIIASEKPAEGQRIYRTSGRVDGA